MAAKLLTCCRRVTAIITDSGSIRKIPIESRTSTMEARVFRSTAGKHGRPQNNQPTAQFYHVSVDNAFPYHIYGAQQDNSNRWHCKPRQIGGDRAGRIGSRSAAASAALFCPIRATGTSFIQITKTPLSLRQKQGRNPGHQRPMPLDNSGHGAAEIDPSFSVGLATHPFSA